MRRRTPVLLAAVVVAAGVLVSPAAAASGAAPGCCGSASAWTTGDKDALGTSATTTEQGLVHRRRTASRPRCSIPRADVPDMQDMQYVVTDGSTFVDLERDATNHTVAMPDSKSLEYTVTNTAKSGKYRITNTYVTDPGNSTLVVNTRFQSLDGGSYRLYLLENPSLAGGGGNDNAWLGRTNGSLDASDTETLFGSPLTVDSALKVSTGFVAHDNGYSGTASDCYQDLSAHKTLANQYDSLTSAGQCRAVRADRGRRGHHVHRRARLRRLVSRRRDGREQLPWQRVSPPSSPAYRSGWNSYVNGLKPAPVQRHRQHQGTGFLLRRRDGAARRRGQDVSGAPAWRAWPRRGATTSTATP